MYMYTCTGLQYLNVAKIIHLNKKTIAMPFPIFKMICLKNAIPLISNLLRFCFIYLYNSIYHQTDWSKLSTERNLARNRMEEKEILIEIQNE